ncbi:hypothetical protein DV736_g5940, partial [Chaetothyriales sp. CBS 134916]
MVLGGEIYSATYSNVPVYELKAEGEHVMRRRSDDWVNATHILKIAGFDKPARTRILEREVQKGVHEKIQGGYGKYQGTWIPLVEGRTLAEKNGIFDKISKIFDYVPGDQSPPPAPKHATASSRPKAQRQPVQARKADSVAYNEEPSRAATPAESASFFGEDDFLQQSQHSTASRKRQREYEDPGSNADDVEHTIYGDELLDYFVTAGDDPRASNILPPTPPVNFEVNRPIDGHGNNALHWACAMGDVQITRDLLARGANPRAQNYGSKETPLIRAVLFTNNYDKKTFPKIVELLAGTIVERDYHGATVFHHIAESSRSRGKWSCARYYCEVLMNKMQEMGPTFVQALLTSVDVHHDTAALLAIRNGCLKVANFLLTHCPEAADIANLKGETANDYLRALREQKESLEQPASSPARPGESFSSRKFRKQKQRRLSSRAALSMYDSAGAVFEEQRDRLADMYEAEMKEKETVIAEAKTSLADFEAQRHKVRAETLQLLAKGDDPAHLDALRHEYHALLRETESLLEQQEHSTLQREVLRQDSQLPPHSFKPSSSFDHPHLTHDEMRAALPWALDLHAQQDRRRGLVHDIARLLGDAGTSEKIGKHRKLVAIATGLKEDELDHMSEELLHSLQTGVVASDRGGGGDGRVLFGLLHVVD